jgi:hypothetical protein
LGLKFASSTNGRGIVEHDFITGLESNFRHQVSFGLGCDMRKALTRTSKSLFWLPITIWQRVLSFMPPDTPALAGG